VKQLAKDPIRTPCMVIPRIIRSTLCLEFNNGVVVVLLPLLLLELLLVILLLLTACCLSSAEDDAEDVVEGELTYAPYAIPNSIPYAVP